MNTASETPDVYVAIADDNRLEVFVSSPDATSRLAEMGFEKIGPRLVKFFQDDPSKSRCMAQLRDAGIPFSSGPGWSPSAVFSYLRDVGLLEGKFLEIFWRSPSVFEVVER